MPPVCLIHITPELPPTLGGIADYTAILSQRLVEVADEAMEPVLVRAGKASGTPPEVGFRCVDHGGTYSAKALCATIEQLADEASGHAVVLLQYSGYGYAPRGAPLWLLRALQQACGENGVPLITMFHELYATGPPWTSAFWLSPVQRYVAAQLARLSSAVVTNRAKSATWLSRYVPAETPVCVQPVFSNVGEPEHVPGWDEREPYAVVFGSANKKRRLYKALKVNHVCQMRSVGVSRVLDIGSKGAAPAQLHKLPIEEHGIQSSEAIGSIFRHARVGLLSYPVDYLTKSGIWSSYVAHGMLPLVFSLRRDTEVVHEGSHFLRLQSDAEAVAPDEAQHVAATAYRWYQTQASSESAARTFARLLDTVCTP